jgi:hypothetical protein
VADPALFPPPLLSERPPAARLVLAVVVPVAFGAICGVLLGLSEAAYIAASLLGILGGLGAGFEHASAREGALRGVVGGALFGLGIVLVDAVSAADAEAELPDPPVLLALLTAAIGSALGALGAHLRRRRR